MTSLTRLPKTALVLVCDARKALFVSNAGTEIRPDLKLVSSLAAKPRSAQLDLKGNRAGRMPDRRPGDGSHGPKSALEEPDYARRDEEEFAAVVAAALPARMKKAGLTELIVVAPSRMIGAIRPALPNDLKGRVLAEIPKSLTHVPMDELPAHLVEKW